MNEVPDNQTRISPLEKRVEAYTNTCEQLCNLFNKHPDRRQFIKRFSTLQKRFIQKEWTDHKKILITIQSFFYALQNASNIHPVSGQILSMISSYISLLYYPSAYIVWKDFITATPLERKRLQNILMLLCSLWTYCANYLIINWHIDDLNDARNLGILATINKTSYRAAELLRFPKNSHSWDDPNA